MRRTILADDDYLVRCYLKTLPSWEQAGFAIEEEARDGEEALEIYRKSGADLIVTDISMPLMDGIELIRKIRREDDQVYIIALSCHSDVEYVKEAMKEGADEYVLKTTLDEDSLLKLLENASSCIDERESAADGKADKERTEDARPHFFRKVLADSLTGKQREKERVKSGVEGEYQCCGAVSMMLSTWNENSDSLAALQQDRYCTEFQDMLNQQLHKVKDLEVRDIQAAYIGSGMLCCFVDLSGVYRSSHMHESMRRATAICKAVCLKEAEMFQISVSSICSGPSCISEAYEQTRQAIKAGFYENDKVMYYERIRRFTDTLPEEAEEALVRADAFRFSHNRDKLMAACRQAGSAMEKSNTDPHVVRKWLKEMMGIICPDMVGRYARPVKMEQVYEIIEKGSANAAAGIAPEIPETAGKAVKIAAEFAASHYKENIGLSDAAEVAGVTPAYLSYRFTQEVGTGFSNFLLEKRMECARNLLMETNLKVKDVAARSGFNDYHYFSKAFKKLNGIGPAEFRKKS